MPPGRGGYSGTSRRLGDCRPGSPIWRDRNSPTLAAPNDQIPHGLTNCPSAGSGGHSPACFRFGSESRGSCGPGEIGSAPCARGGNRLRAASLASYRDLLLAEQRGGRPDQRGAPDHGASVFPSEPEPVKPSARAPLNWLLLRTAACACARTDWPSRAA